MAQDTLVVTLVPARDTTLYQDNGGALASGAGPYLFAGRTDELLDFRRRAVLAFDFAGAIPPRSTIVAVELSLTVSRTVAGNVTVSLHALSQDWGEAGSSAGGGGGQGAPAQTGDATWLHRFYPDEFWNNLGGDFAAAASASQLVAGDGAYTWGSTALMVADAQGWLDLPATNHGWLLRGDETVPRTAKRFDSREGENTPLLTVRYLPPPIPAAHPAGLLAFAMALALLAVLWMRRLTASPANDGDRSAP